jgi:cell division protein FtsW
MMSNAELIRRVHLLSLILIVLIVFGGLMLFSASSRISFDIYNDSYAIIKRYSARLVLSVLIAIAFTFIPSKLVRNSAGWVYILTLIIVVAPFIQNYLTGSSSPARWVRIGSSTFQTAEVVRFFIILFLANYFSKYENRIQSFYEGYLPPLLTLMVPILLIALTPDYSSAASLMAIALVAFFISGTKKRYLFATGGVFTVLSGIYVAIAPYRLQRVLSFFNPAETAENSYQITQSLISLASGGLWGRKLGNSLGKNLFLPEAHTDFIFSILGEEFGFLGTTVTLFLFIALFITMFLIANQIRNRFAAHFIRLTAISIIFYALVNAAVCVQLLPVTGLPMPFVSYSGAQMMVNGALFGIIYTFFKEEGIIGK